MRAENLRVLWLFWRGKSSCAFFESKSAQIGASRNYRKRFSSFGASIFVLRFRPSSGKNLLNWEGRSGRGERGKEGKSISSQVSSNARSVSSNTCPLSTYHRIQMKYPECWSSRIQCSNSPLPSQRKSCNYKLPYIVQKLPSEGKRRTLWRVKRNSLKVEEEIFEGRRGTLWR